ncbi:pseudouridine-5'-phosphatase-like [Oppia nitens]|uniref:pseudouridine-5'-phosphatase-like n=1 Tax=Oppia nitens TaxID=1686743 RepID=UPI0023DB4FA3|nr:pseudouridine-5'-phosphatase-like [Oppia nitens]
MSSYSSVSHCIFDFDGTLINTQSMLTAAISQILAKYDKQYDSSLKSKTIGLNLKACAHILTNELQLPLNAQELYDTAFNSYVDMLAVDTIEFMPGAKRLVKHLAKNGIEMAICTGSIHKTFALKIVNFGQFFDCGQYFNHIVCAGDDPHISRNKPYADPYLYCISLFNPPPDPHKVLVFEDSQTGLESGLSAGCQVVFIPDPVFDKNKFVGQSTLVIDSLEAFDPQIFGLPKF